ncbi:MAG: PLD nuclease N-terminal domain-containing protein [Pseudomonadota bacterium]
MLEIFGLGVLALNIWALTCIVMSRDTIADKVLWCAIVFILPLVGFLVWLMVGPRAEPSSSR